MPKLKLERPFRSGEVWSFRTARFRVYLRLDRISRYRYDGDDEDGSIQKAIDEGEMIAFGSIVVVELDGREIAFDSLYGSVYGADDWQDFVTAHRGADPMNRNCEAFRAAHGANCCIGHYFPDMVRAAVRQARENIGKMQPVPYVRRPN